ncbi:hypothetical protein ACFONK_14735 [Microbacterium barkeri]|uniref:hypothetical protein n=1 Tax=Microbacterium barkeri TaxID=33917 RepID=UPI0036172047
MAEITTAPATTAQWHDVQSALTGGGDGRSCQCMWPVLPNKEWQTTSVDERERMLRDEIDAGPPPASSPTRMAGPPAGCAWARDRRSGAFCGRAS